MTSSQTVLVLQQSGGALGACQAGVYEAMHEAGIGAEQAAPTVGNEPARRHWVAVEDERQTVVV